jgi:redox-sensitive transcriptional activator SoxR
MKVGEVARRSGVNVETLRYYERRGLLPPPDREPSGHRRYDEDTVRFLRAIKEAQAVGFTLTEVGEYLHAARRSGRPSETLRIRMASKIDEIDTRIAGLRRMRDELARVVGCACDSLDHCTCGAAYLARRGREPTTRPTLLHVTNGESAGNTLRATSLGGAVLPWNDVLHEGPVPAVPRRELLDVRAAFLSGCGWGRRSAIRSSLERRDRQLTGALREGVQVVLWFEHDLYDQLQLIDALALVDEAEALPELIVVSSFPGKPSFRGLGELSPDELETLWPSRRQATSETLAAACDAWEAFREPDPVALEAFAGDVGPLELLRAALLRLLEELPAAGDGLSGTERRALEAIAAGASTPATAFAAAQELEEAPFLGDAWFFRALAELGGGDVRLVEGNDGRPLPAPPPLGDGSRFGSIRLRLTGAGESVLRGESDRVELLGLDRWLGGTHLTAQNAWRWDRVERRVLGPPA